MKDLDTIDRLSRAFERAVLVSSFVGGAPIILDRTVESLSALDGYLDAMDPSLEDPSSLRQRMLEAYLRMVRVGALGEAGALTDDGPARAAEARVQRREQLTSYAAVLSAARPRAPVQRHAWTRIVVLRMQVASDIDWQDAKRCAFAVLPAGGEEVIEDETHFHYIVDNDELRLDFAADEDEPEGELSVTFPLRGDEDESARIAEVWSAFAPLGPVFATAYFPDNLAGTRYMKSGFQGAPPAYLFFSKEGATRAGGVAAVAEAPYRVRRLLEGALVLSDVQPVEPLGSYLALMLGWPHLEESVAVVAADLGPIPPSTSGAPPIEDLEEAAAAIDQCATLFRASVRARQDPRFNLGWTLADLVQLDDYLSAYGRDIPSGADPALLPDRAQLVGAYLFELLAQQGGSSPEYKDPLTSSSVVRGGVRHYPWQMAWERLTQGKGRGLPLLGAASEPSS